MTGSDAQGDSTQIRVPSKSGQKIPARYTASVVITQGYAEGMEYPITKAYTIIGRDKTADIVLKDPLVSRQHAAIAFDDGEFTLKDLGSTNGTIVQGKMVEQVVLKNKDKFTIGDTTIQFILEDTGKSRIFEIR